MARISGWGRFPVADSVIRRPAWERELGPSLARQGTIARGLGRSYGDPAQLDGGLVVQTDRLDRFLDWDPATGVLTCQGGVSIDAILDRFVPEGWFVPVTPGTRSVTVGGAIAADVHGKNHHVAGTFGAHVLGLRLLAPTGDLFECSSRTHRDIFDATVGGMGLTGVILSARIQMRRIPSAFIHERRTRTPDLASTMAAMQETDAGHEHSVAWIDCLRRGRGLGRSVLMQGDHAEPDDVRGDPLRRHRPRRPSVPFDLPGFVMDRRSMRVFNAAYYATHRSGERVVPLDDFFYPLDAFGQWNRLYGRRGLLQYQFVLPDHSAEEGMHEMLTEIARFGHGSFLAVLKRFGDAGRGLLSFPRAGYTLAVDLPRRRGTVAFLQRLDDKLIAYGGRTYLAKDAVLTPERFRQMYPEHERFRAVKRRLDPDGRLRSDQALRIGLVP